MKRKWKLVLTGCSAAASLMIACSSSAAKPDQSNPTLITVVKDTPFYAHAAEEAPTGVLGYFQTLKVKEILVDSTTIWYKVDTWLGEQWIPKIAGTVIEGEIDSVDVTMHTLRIEAIRDTPLLDGWQTPFISPQEIYITGRYHDWYRIQSADGMPKWLDAPLLLEEIHEEPADFDMLLTRKEQLYETPYLKKAPIALAPQTVHVLATWDTGKDGYRFHEIVWYKIQTDQGPRWVLPTDERVDVKPVQESITLPTGGYSSSAPETENDLNWLDPGTVLTASARWNDWFQVQIGSTGMAWVNPGLSLKKRPLGTVASNELLHLTEDTAVYRYPSPDAIAHPKGYYSPQQVKSIAMWSGDDMLNWYLFHGFDGDLWVPQPRNASNRSLIGSWSLFRSDPPAKGTHGVSFDVNLSKYSQRHGYEPEEGVLFNLRVRSTSVTLTHPFEFDMQIFRLKDDSEEALKHPEQKEIMWTRKLPSLSVASLERTNLQSLFIEWDQKDAEGKPAPSGEYAARIIPTPVHYILGGESEERTMTKEEMQAAVSDPEIFAILPKE
ncbi:hypothetical protein [Paenibacillus sp. N3.4]|uniref:hypothetical protein n=1 Tax=Paenibacillus sp. N3.4 TaxID=2603222 RepID=UPI0011C9B5EF|nr:hypothetical protein [Paenibacillus sp. N3.4]TXK77357.1 hypothetical protein FU659_23105 [Paenibacillus sp. N3.4]